MKFELERQREIRSVISWGVSLVRRWRSGSFWSFSHIRAVASPMGTLGKRAVASNETIFSNWPTLTFFIFSTNSVEFLQTYALFGFFLSHPPLLIVSPLIPLLASFISVFFSLRHWWWYENTYRNIWQKRLFAFTQNLHNRFSSFKCYTCCVWDDAQINPLLPALNT